MSIKSYVKQVVRGNFVTFNVNFLDSNNNPTIVNGVNVTVAYRINFVPQSNTFVLVSPDGGNNWNGSWSTNGVDADMVEWHLSCVPVANNPVIAEDGQFRVIANDANVL